MNLIIIILKSYVCVCEHTHNNTAMSSPNLSSLRADNEIATLVQTHASIPCSWLLFLGLNLGSCPHTPTLQLSSV